MPKATLNEIVGDPDRRLNLETRFWPKVSRCGPDECWPWIARAVTSFGYGRMTAGRGTHLKAHRVSYALAHDWVPDDLCVCHRCDNPACCNPAHLFLGTQVENQHDKNRKGRNKSPPHRHSAEHHAAKLTATDVDLIIKDDRCYRLIAAEFGVCEMTISRHKKNIAWTCQREAHAETRFNALSA